MARRAAGFGMKLIGYDVAPNAEAKKLGIHFVSLDELLAQSDFLTLHAAATAENKNMIGEKQLRQAQMHQHIRAVQLCCPLKCAEDFLHKIGAKQDFTQTRLQ